MARTRRQNALWAASSAGLFIFLLHICLLCKVELDCAPGDLVMKTHYISHFSPGSLLEMVGQDVGEKLRCPYSECHMGEEMLLQQLNLHLEVVHNKLRLLLEKDTSPGMAEVLSIMYDFDGYKEKNFSENELSPNEEVKSEISLDPPPMKAKIKKTNVDEEYLEVKSDLSWTLILTMRSLKMNFRQMKKSKVKHHLRFLQ